MTITTTPGRSRLLAVLLCGQFMANVDTAIANVVAPSIGAQLGAGPARSRWPGRMVLAEHQALFWSTVDELFAEAMSYLTEPAPPVPGAVELLRSLRIPVPHAGVPPERSPRRISSYPLSRKFRRSEPSDPAGREVVAAGDDVSDVHDTDGRVV